MFNYMQMLAASNPALQQQIQMSQLQQLAMNGMQGGQMGNGQENLMGHFPSQGAFKGGEKEGK